MKFLKKRYNQDDYLKFLADKFNFSKILTPIAIDNNEVKQFVILGQITTGDSKKLPVFEIYIKPKTQLARNRVQLRNLVAKQIPSEYGALAVYIDDKSQQWRFSYIAIEYLFTDKGVRKEETASKRYTYLLGENAQTRTAQHRFATLNKQSTLADLTAAFAVEPLNKEFYNKLYEWYGKAKTKVIFPNDEKAENHTEISLIRMLTRLLFVWFLKEKHLINPDLFDLDKLEQLIDYQKDSSFYKAILQNLFFATLNRKIIDRSFRTTTNGNANGTNYLVTNIYRYQKLFQNTDQQNIIGLFQQTPFLNGGLFECLDREASDTEKQKYDTDKTIRPTASAIRMDGFSDKSSNQLDFPNHYFFNDDEQDLGLISLFQQYQFTVEESTPLDIEVALDPELLGKVFENLLSSYNPETGGSFYTPRKIVSYMVDESLKQHFKRHTDLSDEQIKKDLFIEGEHNLTAAQIKSIITVIDTLKIIDPAVGSGAFPMGILQRLIFILEKIDPENTHFKQQQINKANDIEDEASKKASIEAIEQIFSKENQHNTYGKKLFLIENCVYGVDIQPIAIQICKLRFFISLTIEQQPNDDKDNNYRIKELPNLEAKFIVANTLLPMGDKPQQAGLFDTDIDNLKTNLTEVRHQYFNAKTLKTKRKYREQDKQLRKQMLKTLKQSGITPAVEASMQKVVNWDLYNQNAVADWFDHEWMFGVKEGFDIVLGNPPYIRQESIKEFKPQFKTHYSVFTGTADIYTYFYEKGFNLLSENGHLCYITSNKWMRANYGQKLRHFFKHQTQLKQIIDFEGKQIFENATVDTNILLCGKQTNTSATFNYQKQLPDENNSLRTMAVDDLSQNAYTLQSPKILALKKKIEQIGTPLKEWDINIYRGILTGLNEAFIINTAKRDELIAKDPKSAEIIRPILRGRDIKAYEANWAGLWIIATFPSLKLNIENYPAVKSHLLSFGKDKLEQAGQTLSDGTKSRKRTHNKWFETQDSIAYWNEFSKQKIVWQRVTKEPMFCLVEPDIFIQDSMAFITANKNTNYLMAVLNSKLIKLFVEMFVHKYGDTGYLLSNQYVEQLPIPKISTKNQQPFINLADKILTAKAQNQDTAALEIEIDKMVYQLYDLSKAEITIIES